jgi:hypothetical protein
LDRLLLLFSRESPFQVGMMSRQHLLQGFTESVDEMPAIGNLKSRWSTSGCSTGKGRATIAAANFNGGMPLQPSGKGAWRTRRNNVAGLHFIARRWLSRAPASPPIASPMTRNSSRAEQVR